MKVSKLIALASIAGVLSAGVVSASALAWQPKGVIKKYVQNQTTGGELVDADNTENAVTAKPGDVLKYVIEIRNDGKASDNGHNDMHFTTLTDALPEGVELVEDSAKREITEEIGLIKPGEKVTKEYLVKVTSTKDTELIENEACFTGDSEVKDSPQKGCDSAIVKVSVPMEEPAEEPKKEEPQVQGAGAELPQTGASSFIAPAAAIGSGAVAYAGRLLVLKRREQK